MAVCDLPTTRALRERLQVAATLRRLCGWERIDGIPSEATFSRAFAECAGSELPARSRERTTVERQREGLAQAHANYREAGVARYRERATVECVFGRLKDEFGGRHVRVRGHGKVACHLMLGMLALTVDQLLRMAH